MRETTKNGHAKVAALTVRLPSGVLSRIDKARAGRAVRVPRNTWILEALIEKLGREEPVKGGRRPNGT